VDTGIFDGVSSSADITLTSLLNPTSFPSLVLATNNEGCNDAGDPVWVSVSVISVILEDRTLEFIREAHATPVASSAGNGCCKRLKMGWMNRVKGKRGSFVASRGGEHGGGGDGVVF
jgi:hypothetical protein